MKKYFVLAFVAAGLTFTSCNEKKAPAPETDETEIVEDSLTVEQGVAAADEVIAALTDNIEKKDASAVEAALNAVKEKVTEFISKNPEVAKEYLAKVQNFLKDNKDKLTAVIGTNAAVTALVDNIANIPSDTVEKLTGATDALKALGIDASSLAGDAVEKAGDIVDGVKDATGNAVNEAKDAVEGAKDAAAEKVNNAVEDAKEKAGDAVDKAAADAKKKLGL